MRIGVVVQRYGREVNGGAELLCRTHAEHLVRRPEVTRLTVFTTCARDHKTWANHYAPGREEIDGVEVERFPVVTERLEGIQNRLGSWVHERIGPIRPLAFFEPVWFLAQGPLAPGLLRRLVQVHRHYDVFVFYTYLYFSTVFGLPLVADRAVLFPTAHDEWPIRLGWFRWLFKKPRAFGFLTPEEQDFMLRTFGTRQPADVVGTGVGTPDEGTRAMPPLVEAPYVLYVGRVEPSKGFPGLFQAFVEWKKRHAETEYRSPSGGTYRGRDLKLVLAGRVAWTEVPARDDIVSLGFVSDEQKSILYRHAELFVLPSQYESLSIVILEAWAHDKPVLVNRACAATTGQVERARGGASYDGIDGFVTTLSSMLSDPDELERAARSGRAYVDAEYAWPHVEDRLLRLLGTVAHPEVG